MKGGRLGVSVTGRSTTHNTQSEFEFAFPVSLGPSFVYRGVHSFLAFQLYRHSCQLSSVIPSEYVSLYSRINPPLPISLLRRWLRLTSIHDSPEVIEKEHMHHGVPTSFLRPASVTEPHLSRGSYSVLECLLAYAPPTYSLSRRPYAAGRIRTTPVRIRQLEHQQPWRGQKSDLANPSHLWPV